MKYRVRFIFFTFIFLTLICFLAEPSRFASANSDLEAKTATPPENQSSDDSLQQNNPADLLAGTAFEQEAKLLGSDGAAQDNFSFSVAISGDTAVVGAPRNSGGTGLQSRGSAYVYVRSGNTWTEQQKLAPSDGATTDQFGYAVAISGNTIAVGRHNTTTGQNRADGKVYIFTRSGSVWTETQTLVSNDIVQGDSFGYALAFEGDTIAVGARNKANAATLFQGAAYIFTRPSSGGSFTQQAKLLASDGGFADFFGESVALSGDTAIIGSVNDFGTANADGRAYVFVRNGSNWTQQQVLQAQGGSLNGAFGVSVSVSGDYALIGANTEPIGSSGELGAAYVFVRNGSVWTQQQKFTAEETTPRNDRFGYAVAIKGDTLAIGSPAHEFVSNIANHGAVYVYNRSGTNWPRTQKLLHNDPAPDALGQSLAFDGNSLLAGAPSKNSARGAAYIFKTIQNAQAKLLGEAVTSSQYGQAVAISGNTAAVGSFIGVYIFERSGDNWQFTQRISSSVNGNTTLAPGSSIAISGDTMVVGAGGSRINGTSGQGAVLVYVRNGSTWVLQQQLTASDGGVSDLFGTQIAFSGDTIIVGAHGDTIDGNTQRGSAYIFTRSGATWTEQQKLTAADGAATDFFGTSVAISGDTVIIGAEFDNFGEGFDQGAAYIFTRSGTTWTQQTKLTASDAASNKRFGGSVALENDTAIIGSLQAGAANENQGAVYVFTRTSGAAWSERQKLSARDGKTFDNFGGSLALSGDKLLVGAYSADNRRREEVNTGAVYIFNRQGSNWSGGGKFLAFDGETGDQLGTSVAFSDNLVISGAVGDDMPGVSSQGSAYIFDFETDVVNFGLQNSDFDGDGKSDLSVFRPSENNWYVLRSTDGFAAVQFGLATDKLAPADYDGDGRTDIAVWRETEGNFYILNSSDNSIRIENFGLAGDVLTVGDWDGDGKADPAVYRAGAQGTFYYRGSLNNPNGNLTVLNWGTSGDKPVHGDFDGDGRLDPAVFRPSSGVWYIRKSSDGAAQFINWGISTDKSVAADYDGDGKTDVAVYRNGIWYILQSSNGQPRYENFGVATDAPVPADYDGDGKSDIAVYRNGTWYIQQSTNGLLITNFGSANDKPVPNAYLP